MIHRSILAALCGSVLFAGAAIAEEARFTITETADGFVRMDNQTGQISTCTTTGDQMVCRMAADDRTAYDADIAALEQRVEALEELLADGVPVASDGLPSPEEFDQTLDYMERFFNRFRGMVDDFTADEPPADRT